MWTTLRDLRRDARQGRARRRRPHPAALPQHDRRRPPDRRPRHRKELTTMPSNQRTTATWRQRLETNGRRRSARRPASPPVQNRDRTADHAHRRPHRVRPVGARPVEGGPSGQAPAFTLPTTAGTTVSPGRLPRPARASLLQRGRRLRLLHPADGPHRAGAGLRHSLTSPCSHRDEHTPRSTRPGPSASPPPTCSTTLWSRRPTTPLDKGMHPGLPGHGFV